MHFEERNWLTIKEAASLVGLSAVTMRNYLRLRKGRPPFYRLVPKGNIRFPKEEFIKWATGQLQKEK
jgi:excisionase family DNA binding protein